MKHTSNIIRIVAVCLVLNAVSGTLSAQSDIRLSGQVCDAATGQNLPFAGLQISESNLGKICNEHGQFNFFIPEKYKNRRLIVSYTGYKSYEIPISNFEKGAQQIRLYPKDETIKAVTVNPDLAKSIIQRALNRIPNNYSSKALMQRASYRETVKENQDYIEHIELVLEIYKASYASAKNDQVKALQGKRADSLKKSVLYDYVYFVNGPYEALSCDIAKNPDDFIMIPQNSINFLHPRDFQFYYYEMLFMPEISDSQFLIRFRPKSRRAVYRGSLLINRKSLAFTALYYEISPAEIKDIPLMSYDVLDFLAQNDIYSLPLHYECYALFSDRNNNPKFEHAAINYSYILENKSKNREDTIYYASEISIHETLTKPAEKYGLWERLAWDTDIRYLVPKENPNFEKYFRMKPEKKYYEILKKISCER